MCIYITDVYMSTQAPPVAKRARKKTTPGPPTPTGPAGPCEAEQLDPKKKCDQIDATLQQMRSVTMDAMLKGTPGCRAADARNKALKGMKLAQEIAKLPGRSEEANRLSTQSNMLTDMIEVTDMIRTEQRCSRSIKIPTLVIIERVPHKYVSILSKSKEPNGGALASCAT